MMSWVQRRPWASISLDHGPTLGGHNPLILSWVTEEIAAHGVYWGLQLTGVGR